MKVAVYNNGIPFHGNSPLEGPLGGSESGIVYMARELVVLGLDVAVYCNCPSPGRYDGVEYIHFHRFFEDYRRAPWDVLIGFRSFDPFHIGRVAPRTVFWTGDAFDQPAIAHLGHPSLQESIDLHFCVSEWHRRTLIDAFGLAESRVVATRNGFREDLVPPPETWRKDWTTGVYSSTPFRGLEQLLEMFPRIRNRVPEMTLEVFSSMTAYGWTRENDRSTFGRIYDLASQDGVRMHGGVGQSALVGHLADSGFLLYPNTFDETSCIAAIEAQAAGAVVVTSARAGLLETVVDGETGVCIEGDPASDAYQRKFIEAVAGLAGNRDRHRSMSEAARRRARDTYAWSAIAREWVSIFQSMEPRPVAPRWSGPLALLEKAHRYLEKGNRNASLKILGRLQAQPFYEREVATLERKLLKAG